LTIAGAKVANALHQVARQMLNAEGIGVAAHLVGRVLIVLFVVLQIVQNLRQVSVDANHGRSLQTACQVAVLAMGRTPLRQVKLPVRRKGDRAELELTGGR